MTTCKQASCPDAPYRKKAGFCRFHYNKRHRIGLTARADAGPVLAHVNALRDLGWNFKEIGQAAGVSSDAVALMVRVQNSQVHRPTANGILAIPLIPCTTNRPVDRSGTRRRLQALSRLGWPQGIVAKRAGVRLGTVNEVHRTTIPSESADKIAKVYEELSHIPGPSQRTASYAKTMGWLPPLAWEDIDAGVIAPLYVSAFGTRRRVQELVEIGYTYQEIADGAGLGRNTVYEIVRGRNDKVLTETAAKVSAAFNALSYVDEILVELFIKGEQPVDELSKAEKREAAQQLRAKGKTTNQIALKLHWHHETARKAAA